MSSRFEWMMNFSLSCNGNQLKFCVEFSIQRQIKQISPRLPLSLKDYSVFLKKAFHFVARPQAFSYRQWMPGPSETHFNINQSFITSPKNTSHKATLYSSRNLNAGRALYWPVVDSPHAITGEQVVYWGYRDKPFLWREATPILSTKRGIIPPLSVSPLR